MGNKIECKWGENSEFSREVIAHFILKENPEYIDVIDEKVEKWFSDFKGSDYEGDCMTACKFENWFETYFVDLGCDSKHVLPYVKEFWNCFSEIGTSVFDEYKRRIIGGSLEDEELQDFDLYCVPSCMYKREYRIR